MMKKILPLTILVFLVPANAFSQGEWTKYYVTNLIRDIDVDGDFVWCTTESGIVRWDTRDSTFMKFTGDDIAGDIGIPCGAFWSPIGVDSHHNIWAYAADHLIRFDGVKWKQLDWNVSIYDMALGNDGSAWVVLANGLVGRYTADSPDRLTLCEFDFKGNNIAIDSKNTVWITRRITSDDDTGGLVKYDGVTIEYIGVEDGLPDKMITDVYVDHLDNVWVGFKNGIAMFDGTQWVSYMNPELLQDLSIYDIEVAQDGSVWMSDLRRLLNMRNGLWEEHIPPSDIRFDRIRNLEIDGNGIIWCSSYAGLLRYNGESWSVWKEPLGPLNNPVQQLFIDSKNRKWFYGHAGYRDGISYYDNGEWHHFYEDETGEASLRAVAEDDYGTIWFSNSTTRLSQYERGQWILHVAEPISTIIPVNNLIWVGGSNGVCNFDGYTWTYIPTDIISAAYNSAVDSSNNIWFGNGKNLVMYDGVSWTKYRVSVGSEFLVADGNDGVWVGGVISDDHILRFSDGVWVDHTEFYGAPMGLRFLQLDNDNVIWAGTNDTIWSYDGLEWVRHGEFFTPSDDGYRIRLMAVGPDNTKYFVYNVNSSVVRYDGKEWKSLDCQGLGGIQCIDVDHDGTVWVGTNEGVASYRDNTSTIIEDIDNEPVTLAIEGNYPNPFNPETTIAFSLPEAGRVTFDVYNIAGQKVRTLESGTMSTGQHETVWNGLDDSGAALASGVYFGVLRQGEIVTSNRMLLMK